MDIGIWSQAKELAAVTPAERNRYVDFLRAVSILFVVTGHWLIAGYYYDSGALYFSDILVVQPGTQWLTWVFQVMPIFFIVGGYANAVSLESARRRGLDYATWLASRLHRLVTPLLALLFGWAAIAGAMYVAGIEVHGIQQASRAALIPIWFLAIYIAVVILAPATHGAWRRWGYGSLAAFAAVGVLIDVAFFAADLRWLGWSNYFWVWLSVHQLGYAWRDGRLGGPVRLVAYSVLAFLLLVLLVHQGPYPLAMAGSPDENLSNSLPPKMTLLVLGIIQFGLLLAIEKPMRRVLAGLRLWAATVLINSMIMTVYLWHLTVLLAVIAVLYFADGAGLGLQPGTSEWWLTRLPWIALLYLVLLPVTLLLSVFERRGKPADAAVPAAWRQVGGAFLICLGVAVIGRFGIGGAPLPGIEIVAYVLVATGAAIVGVIPGLR